MHTAILTTHTHTQILAAATAEQKEEGITTVWAAGEATNAQATAASHSDSDYSDDDSVRQVRVFV